MKHQLKVKFFGSTTTNFYGWLFAGLIVFGCAFFGLIQMLYATQQALMIKYGFLSVIMLLVGIFGLLLQQYHSKVATDLSAS